MSLLSLITTQCFAEIKESDLFLFGEMTKYKTDVVQMLNKLSVEHPACKQRIAAISAGISKSRSTPETPSFFVQCGDNEVPEVVRFTLDDIRLGNTPAAAKAIEQGKGLLICKKEAKRRASNPSSVDFSMFFNVGYNPKPNGNAIVSSAFTAQNDFGVEQKYRIFCFFDGQKKLTDVSIKPFE